MERSPYLYSNTIWPIQQVCFTLHGDNKDLNEWLLTLYVGIKLRVKKMENIYLFRVKAWWISSLPLIWGHSWSKILFAHEVFHFSDSPCLLTLLHLKTLLSCKWLILLLVILANINRWLGLLIKCIWVSCRTKSCLYIIFLPQHHLWRSGRES